MKFPLQKLLPILIGFTFLTQTKRAFSQKLSAGPQVLTFYSDADDSEQPYSIYIPKNFDAGKKYPLVIMLHGAGSNLRLAMRRVFGKSNEPGATDVETSRVFPDWKDVPYIVAAPNARGTSGYQGIVEKDVYDMLADIKKRFSIDTNRIYLTGLSMGGGGTLWLGLTRPDIWAAIAPVCPAPPKGTDLFTPNALNYPVHFFQGGADPVVAPAGTREWVKKLKELGTTVEYTEYPGVQHNSWEKAYQDEYIFNWFAPYKRNPYPENVRFTTNLYKYNSAYWVVFDKLLPGKLAEINAKFTGVNSINIKTSLLDAFTLHLNGHPSFKKMQSLILNIDGNKITSNGTDQISFTKENGKWLEKKYVPSTTSKQKGSEGPIYDAFSSRHIYVYGTKDNPGPEELKSRMNIAVQAANWSVYRGEFLGRVMFFPRVIADKEVRPSDLESSNLILFGTVETNNIISDHSNMLPMNLDPKNLNEYGLLYIFPNGPHYMVVSSGLPWWAGVEEKGFPFVPLANRGLSTFKDYIIFKSSINNVIADGFFDENWKIPEETQKNIKTSGIIK